jgi:hypothetical protein
MGWYCITLLGRNFHLTRDGKTGRFGFYTTRQVEADDPALAEGQALQADREDESLTNIMLNASDDIPLIFVEQVSAEGSRREGVDTGYRFFPEQDAAAEACLDLDLLDS